MPIEVSPAPFRSEQNFPYALERNYSGQPMGWANSAPTFRSSPMTPLIGAGVSSSRGPLPNPYIGAVPPVELPPPGPGPNSCLPNGMKNPWAPYHGETYRPAAEGAINRQINAVTASGAPLGGAASSAMSASYAGGSLYDGVIGGSGAARSIANPRTRAMSVSAGSMVSGSIAPGLCGYRVDDGWDGAVGRRHAGVAPDMTSTAGAIPRLPSSQIGEGVGASGSWLHAPSSYHNHRSMVSPSITSSVPIGGVRNVGGYAIPPGGEHQLGQVPIKSSLSIHKRRPSLGLDSIAESPISISAHNHGQGRERRDSSIGLDRMDSLKRNRSMNGSRSGSGSRSESRSGSSSSHHGHSVMRESG